MPNEKLITWAWEQCDRPASEKLILLGLAFHASDEGCCIITQGKLAEKCGLSREHVNRGLRNLSKDKLVSVLPRSSEDGGTLPHLYVLPV